MEVIPRIISLNTTPAKILCAGMLSLSG